MGANLAIAVFADEAPLFQQGPHLDRPSVKEEVPVKRVELGPEVTTFTFDGPDHSVVIPMFQAGDRAIFADEVPLSVVEELQVSLLSPMVVIQKPTFDRTDTIIETVRPFSDSDRRRYPTRIPIAGMVVLHHYETMKELRVPVHLLRKVL